MKKKYFIALTVMLWGFICIGGGAMACNTFLSIGNWNNSVLWSSCSGAGRLPGQQ